MKKIIVAIDSFKGCLTSAEANQAASEGILSRMNDVQVVQMPVSDGGEGFLEAFQRAMGGSMVEVNVKDPLMRTIVAQYLVQDDTAVIEIAKASGLTLLSPEERNPMVATSYGTGQLVVDAGFSRVACINPPNLPLEIALQPTTAKENIRQTIAQSFDEF